MPSIETFFSHDVKSSNNLKATAIFGREINTNKT
jgi:hypothetical protein